MSKYAIALVVILIGLNANTAKCQDLSDTGLLATLVKKNLKVDFSKIVSRPINDSVYKYKNISCKIYRSKSTEAIIVTVYKRNKKRIKVIYLLNQVAEHQVYNSKGFPHEAVHYNIL